MQFTGVLWFANTQWMESMWRLNFVLKLKKNFEAESRDVKCCRMSRDEVKPYDNALEQGTFNWNTPAMIFTMRGSKTISNNKKLAIWWRLCVACGVFLMSLLDVCRKRNTEKLCIVFKLAPRTTEHKGFTWTNRGCQRSLSLVGCASLGRAGREPEMNLIWASWTDEVAASGSRKAVCSRLKWAGVEWTLTLSGGPTVAVWLSNEVSRWAELRPGLRSVVLLAVRPVAQDVVDLRHDVGRHLRKDLSRHRKRKSVTGSEFQHHNTQRT